MTAVPAEAITAATEALASELPKSVPWIRATQSQERIRAIALDAAVRALEAAAPLIREAAVEAERERADVMKLGGMEIEAAVHRALNELPVTRTAPAVRELKDLYRAGVAAGLDIALRGATPEPEAVRVIRARVYAEVRELATEYSAVYLSGNAKDGVMALPFADRLTEERSPDGSP